MQPAGRKGALIAFGVIQIILGIILLVIYNAAGLRNTYEDFIKFISYISIIMGIIVIVFAFVTNKNNNDGGNNF